MHGTNNSRCWAMAWAWAKSFHWACYDAPGRLWLWMVRFGHGTTPRTLRTQYRRQQPPPPFRPRARGNHPRPGQRA